MPYSSVDITNRALVAVGATPVTAFEDGSTEAEIAKALYFQVRDGLLTRFRWTFSETKLSLGRQANPISSEYLYSYTLPTDFLAAVTVLDGDDYEVSYRIAGRSVATDAEIVTLVYCRQVPEQWMPPYFVNVLARYLAAEFCIPITGDYKKSTVLFQLAELDFKRACTIDSQQDTPRVVQDDTIIAARRF